MYDFIGSYLNDPAFRRKLRRRYDWGYEPNDIFEDLCDRIDARLEELFKEECLLIDLRLKLEEEKEVLLKTQK